MSQDNHKRNLVALLDEEGKIFVYQGLIDSTKVGVTEELFRSLKKWMQFGQFFLSTYSDCL